MILSNNELLWVLCRAMNQAKQRVIVDMLEREESVLSVNDVKTMVEVI